MKYILIFSLLLTLFSCKETGLGNNYYYFTEYDARDIGSPYGAIVYKSNNKNIIENPFIYADVINCVSNNQYILALQRPNKELFYKLIKGDFEFWEKYPHKTKMDTLLKFPHGSIMLKDILGLMKKYENQSGKIADSIINNDSYYKKLLANKYNYWIIYAIKDSLIGPLNKEEFLQKRNEMKIPEYLQFSHVSK